MKCFFKGILAGAVIVTATLTASAQQINENELKVNIADITNSTAKLMALKPVTFQYDVKRFPGLKLNGATQYGFLASDVKATFPDFVYEYANSAAAGKNSTRVVKHEVVNLEKMIPVLVQAIKEQQEEIDLLKKELQTLKKVSAE